MECSDYDLCQICSDKNLHSEHYMIKMIRPNQHFLGGFRRCGRGQFGDGQRSRGAFGGRCGAGPRFYRHFMRQQQDNKAGFPMPADIAAYLGQFKGKELAELVEAHLPEYLRTEKINEMINQFKTGEQAEQLVDYHTLLENIGQFLREILSPFGIDCDYSVDNQQAQNPAEQSDETKEQSQKTAASSNTSTEPKPSAPPETENSSTSSDSPAFSGLIDHLQNILSPMLQPTASLSSSSTINATNDDQPTEEQRQIDECIKRMTAMGFVDSSGALNQLIKSKKGDLNQVLDALNPRNNRN